MNGPSIAPHRRPPSGGSPLPFCEQCGNLVGAVSNLIGVGLESCPACGLFACNRCRAAAKGACPGCGHRVVAVAAASERTTTAPIAPGAPRRRRVAIGVGIIAIAASGLLFANGIQFGPTGQVESAIGSPAPQDAAGINGVPESAPAEQPAVDAGGEGVDSEPAAGTPPSDGSAPSSTSGGTPGGTAQPTDPNGAGASPTGPPGTPSTPTTTPAATSTSAPQPTPTVVPTASPTIAPTPDPTPTPTPTATPGPTPTPACNIVPDLVGMTVFDARAAWAAAGFTGPFSPAFGQNNKTVLNQSQAAGDCQPPAASITVTFS